MAKGWFGPKTIGWGVTAKSWQGWLVTVALVVLIAISVRWLGPALAEMSGVDRALITPLIACRMVSLAGSRDLWRHHLADLREESLTAISSSHSPPWQPEFPKSARPAGCRAARNCPRGRHTHRRARSSG